MPTTQLEQQILGLAENLLELDFSSLKENPPTLPTWQNLNVNDFIDSVNELKRSMKELKQEGLLSRLPWNILHSLHGMLNNAFTHCQNFINSQNQQQFHQAFQHVENARTNLQTWGINYLYSLGNDLEDKSQLLDSEIQKALAHNKEVESIKQNVNRLVEPAVAGSLSKSFENRKNALHTNQNRWFWSSALMAVLALAATYYVVSSIIGIFDDNITAKLAENASSGPGLLWTSILLRIGLLAPIYSLFVLAFNQYRKERNLEEEYAHKAAVATSLPNYGDLAVDNQVKDQILSEASKVIFTTPSDNNQKNVNNNANDLEQLNQLMGSINNFASK